MFPKFLKDIIDDFKLENILTWLKEFVYFFIAPKKYFKIFYNRDYKAQVYQIIFYTIISILANWLFFEKSELKDIYKTSFSVLLLTIPFIIANSLSVIIVSKKQFNFWKIFSFVYTCWLLYFIPSIICLNLFISTENYTFYFFSNILNLLAFLYCLFLIWHVFFERVKHIVFGYLLNIFIFNVSLVLLSLLFFDSYSKENTFDPILRELDMSLEKVQSYKGIPYTFVEEVFPKQKFKNIKLSFVKNDTVYYYGSKHILFFRELAKRNVTYLDSIQEVVMFRRNKVILIDLSKYYRNISTYFDYPPCDTCLVEHIVSRNRIDSSLISDKKEYIIDAPYLIPYENHETKIKELNKLSEFATSPGSIIGFLLSPVQLIVSFFGITENNDMHISF